MARTIVFTVTNDLNTDQRMIRICGSLADAGFDVLLVGRQMPESIPLVNRNFRQKRLKLLFVSGWMFYAEYNIRLFLYLLFARMHVVCAIDLDSILPVYFISRLKNVKRVYDAHELFCEMKEIVARPVVYNTWKKIEKFAVPKFPHGYTVNGIIGDEFKKMYGVEYGVIRSISLLRSFDVPEKKERFILYQGAVNEGRSFETLIPAMKDVDAKLIICGNGNFMTEAVRLVREQALQHKIIFRGQLIPEDLIQITRQAYIGLTLFDKKGLSNYYSLANRFFDYIHALVPQVCVDYPAYSEINNLHRVAVLIAEPDAVSIAKAVNLLLADADLYKNLQDGCRLASQVLNWQNEERKLISFYKIVLESN